MTKCYQCKKPAKENSYFCSEECRDKYWPKKKKDSLMDRLKRINEARGLGRKKLQLHKLKCGYEAWIDFDSKERCRKCGAWILWATTDKNKRPMPVNMVGIGEYDTHFATCEKSVGRNEQLIKDAEEVFL